MTSNAHWKRFWSYIKLFNEIGVVGVVACKRLPKSLIKLLAQVGINLDNRDVWLKLPKYEHPILMRYQSSDPSVFLSVLVEEEYAYLDYLDDPKLIIDCGANVGYSAIFFLNKFSNSHIIAIEPDPENFKICERNLEPFRDRITLVKSGIWSHSTGLIVCQAISQGGLHWATEVRACREDETPDLMAVDIPTLIKNSGFSRVNCLKIDIEKSEIELFSNNSERWLDKIDNIAIELHDEECKSTFFNALTNYEYRLSTVSDLTICQQIKRKQIAQAE